MVSRGGKALTVKSEDDWNTTIRIHRTWKGETLREEYCYRNTTLDIKKPALKEWAF
jgi:hypothetical protein